jgi:uncharacterized protein
MARLEMTGMETSQPAGVIITDDIYFDLGLQYAAGRAVPRDLVAAHKWFNIAALRGNKEAASYRKEAALEMADYEIALALASAREYMTIH